MSESQRLIGFIAALLGLGVIVGVLGTSIFGASGAEGAIVTQLKLLERDGVDVPLPFGTLHGSQVHFQRLSVVLDADGGVATMTGTLDFTGHVFRGAGVANTHVSSLGLERARFVLRDGEWVAEGENPLARLSAIVSALERRRDTLERADGGAPWPDVSRRRLQSESWFIRSERGLVEIAEDYRLTGFSPTRPVDERATRRLSLQEDTDGGFSFPGGIM